MAVRKQRATTTSEIMETDINIAIKKAKTRFRSEGKFYILKYKVSYFASGYPEVDKSTGEDIYYQKWIFVDGRWKND